MSRKPLEGKHKVYRATIDITETYEVFLEKDFIDSIRGRSGLTIEEAVEEAIQNGWPGYDIPVSCWDDETLASNGTRSLGSDKATEVLSVDRCKTIEMKGGFPNA
jgi:ssRNA-specific RNase YbeY (16S rRNA maturation enzyme)